MGQRDKRTYYGSILAAAPKLVTKSSPKLGSFGGIPNLGKPEKQGAITVLSHQLARSYPVNDTP